MCEIDSLLFFHSICDVSLCINIRYQILMFVQQYLHYQSNTQYRYYITINRAINRVTALYSSLGRSYSIIIVNFNTNLDDSIYRANNISINIDSFGFRALILYCSPLLLELYSMLLLILQLQALCIIGRTGQQHSSYPAGLVRQLSLLQHSSSAALLPCPTTHDTQLGKFRAPWPYSSTKSTP